MPMTSGVSFLISSTMIVLLFSGMHIFSNWLTSSQMHIVFGGFLGSVIFMLLVTALGNVEMLFFGRNFQTKLFPEVVFCLITTLIMTSTIHRVCTTTCFMFSMLALYYMNKIAQRTYAPPPQAAPAIHHHQQRKKRSIFS